MKKILLKKIANNNKHKMFRINKIEPNVIHLKTKEKKSEKKINSEKYDQNIQLDLDSGSEQESEDFDKFDTKKLPEQKNFYHKFDDNEENDPKIT